LHRRARQGPRVLTKNPLSKLMTGFWGSMTKTPWTNERLREVELGGLLRIPPEMHSPNRNRH
jgi:hypothetical protein